MRLHDGWRCARAWLALGMLGLGMLGLACGETAAKTSSETNWFRSCASSDECDSGSCRCGVCTLECENDGSCASLANATCALAESPGHDTQCGAGVETEGICLPRCDPLHPCDDPLLGCQAADPQGALGFSVPSGEPSGATYCAPRRCSAPADCPAAGTCRPGGAGSFCEPIE